MRKSGVLMHITSLPSRGGVGTLGKASYDFVDFVKASGMNIWQMLPVGPTGYAESPYQSASSYAGNPLMIDFDMMEADGLLPGGSYEPLPIREKVDFDAVKAQNTRLLKLAFGSSRDKIASELEAFKAEKAWVQDFALFYAIKEHFGYVSWMQWPDEDIRHRKAAAIERYQAELKDSIEYYVFCQYVFFSQWERLHAYARERGVELMGDMPIYVAADSSDVWLNPDMFELDEDVRPIRIAGVPPDYFQKDGQRWGNPLYAWKKHEETKYAWWIARLKALGSMFDILRIDHFIGFANYYAIPATEPTARNGKYELGPNAKLFRRIRKELPELNIVAEDLGVVSKRVKKLLAFTGYPGMKILQFAFDGGDDSQDLPENYESSNCIVYTGTHDNETTIGWWQNTKPSVRAFARKKLGMAETDDDIISALLRAGWESIADTVIIPMQDLLGCGAEARMNFPGTVGGNWLWRMLPADYAPIAARIRVLNRRYGRGNVPALDADAIIADAEAIVKGKYHADIRDASAVQLHEGVSSAVMMAIAPMWADDHAVRLEKRHALYLSAEYLVGRLVYNNLFSLGLLDEVKALLAEKGVDLATLEDIEDAALGNGGLGRLAACFLDSAATHAVPLDGYGLRYKYGLFKQEFVDGKQHELPDDWTKYGDPWSIRRDELSVLVPMKGLTVRAVPYDMPVVGYGGKNFGTLRLWQCESTNEFDFELFNAQDYAAAAKDKNTAEDITKLLYPNDTLRAGKLMRVRQQYVLCSASLQDMLRTYRAQHGSDYSMFPELHSIQLNDTHPTMAIPELIRLLMAEGMDFAAAFALAQKSFNYTNHTVMREALECWDVSLLSDVAPEMVEVIKLIDKQLAKLLKRKSVRDKVENPSAMRIIQNKRVHMANLAVYASSYVNGVAAIHSQILKDDVFREWYAIYPDRFQNKTNGITQRRWLGLCNPELTKLIESKIGSGFMTNLYELEKLKPLIDDNLAQDFIAVKREKKEQLAAEIYKKEGVKLDPDMIFDIQVKRLHEYKRQFMNALSILNIYFKLKDGTLTDFTPTAYIFGAKAAAGYARAKAIIKLINMIADKVNNDPQTSHL
ncbi:MAG: 4-alpha-glucanotransferase, partial [Clostridia bacterium]|nr:4-alpha-glucanotransferase [Clostridia bacterium]